jgi:hypothetical protein
MPFAMGVTVVSRGARGGWMTDEFNVLLAGCIFIKSRRHFCRVYGRTGGRLMGGL